MTQNAGGILRRSTATLAARKLKHEQMSEANKYGLFRDPPDPAKRQVRQRCYFGCVKCGFAVYEYHHFNPPFREAKTHDPEGITLLCGKCHNLVTRGRMSNQTVGKYNRTPKCLERGFSREPFDVGDKSPVVVLGNMTFVNTPIILEAFGEPLIAVEPPEEPGTPFRITAAFQDNSGNELFRIVQNEWQGLSSNWDIETKGSRTIIRQALRQIALMIRTEPPGKLVIEQLNMFCRGLRIIGREGEPTTAYLPDGTVWFRVPGSGATISNCDRGIVIQ